MLKFEDLVEARLQFRPALRWRIGTEALVYLETLPHQGKLLADTDLFRYTDATAVQGVLDGVPFELDESLGRDMVLENQGFDGKIVRTTFPSGGA